MAEALVDSAKLKIAIYRSSSIGDTVLATSCLNLLHNLSIDADITWIGRQPALGLLQAAYPNMRCIEVQRTDGVNSHWEVARQLEGIDFIIDLQANLRSRIICSAATKLNGSKIFSCPKKQLQRSSMVLRARIEGRRRKLPSTLVQPARLQHEVMSDTLRAALLKYCPKNRAEAIRVAYAHPWLPLPENLPNTLWLKELRLGKSWVAIAPGAQHEPKQSPSEIFLKALLPLKKLSSPPGIVYLGNEQDRKLAVDIADTLNWPGSTLNLAGKLSLWESAIALSAADALLSNDSALAHIAEAVGTPSGVLFGPTVEGFGFKPWMRESQAFSLNLGCRPCSKHGRTPCRYNDRLCFNGLPPEPMAAFLADHINAAAKPA